MNFRSKAMRRVMWSIIVLTTVLAGSPNAASAGTAATIVDYSARLDVRDGEATLKVKYECFLPETNPNGPSFVMALVLHESEIVLESAKGDAPDPSDDQRRRGYLVRCDGNRRSVKLTLTPYPGPAPTPLDQDGTYILQLTLTTTETDPSNSDALPFDRVLEPIPVRIFK